MIKLLVVTNPRLGQAFVDYMASREIEVFIAPEPAPPETELPPDQAPLTKTRVPTYGLWLADLTHQVEVQAEIELFMRDPYAPKYQAASWQVADSRSATFTYAGTSIFRSIVSNAGPFTLTVMFASILIYLGLFLGFNLYLFDALHFPADSSQQWQLWRLFSHALLHFSATHIVFNLLWWWVLGGQIEKVCGSVKLTQIFLFSALFSGLGQFYMEGPNFGGMSGVVYALLGYLWMMQQFAPARGLRIAPAYIGFMLLWLVLGYFEPFGMSIANTAHTAGLVAGCLLGLFDAKRYLATHKHI